jgi:predicted CXXCH cytochrome family protein
MRHAFLAAALLLTFGWLSAQERHIAIFNEIEDAREREAFREVWDTEQPQRQRDLAARFIEQYPRSILLREAYELAARAHVATGDLAAGLDWAVRSLRLMPENPFLLVLIADTAAKQRDFDLAVSSARDALRYLEHAGPPSPVSSKQWPQARDQLRATALFVLGRVAAVRQDYRAAEQSLLASLTLNPDDMEALYAIGVVRMAVRADEGASRAFARVARADVPMSGAARESLRVLYARSGTAASRSFDAWEASLTWNPPEPPQPVAASGQPGRYAGSISCRECHAQVYDNWKATGMANMFRPYDPAAIIGDFSGESRRTVDLSAGAQSAKAETAEAGARPVMHGSKHFIEIRSGGSQEWNRYPVDYVIGSKWQQAYATRLPDSRVLVFPIQYSRLHRGWVNYWKRVDAPGSPRADISRFHEVPPDAVYQSTCAACHTSQLSLPNGSTRPANAVFREPGVNCEMCHGPSLGHVEALKRHSTRQVPGVTHTPISFSRLPAERYVAVCAQCHAQSAVHDAQPGGAVNFSATGAAFRTYTTELPSSFSRRAFYRDGRHRATTFISEAFARTACFRKGGATCGSCHDPHPSNAATNPTSLKFGVDADAMCVQCHKDLRERPERHTRHAAQTEASRCVSCHMPRIMEALLFQARTHEIDDIPDAEMTGRFGNGDSPNACLTCHQDRSISWLRGETAAFRRVN